MTEDHKSQPITNDARRRVLFGPYDVDFHTQELRKHGTRLKVAGQPLQVLEMLLARPGELVTREDLQRRLWPENTFSDFNHGLNAAVNKLRDTLSDSADDPRYIETLPRRGYRFIGAIERPATEKSGVEDSRAPIETPPDPIPVAAIESIQTAQAAPVIPPAGRTRRLTLAIAATLGVLIIGAAGVLTVVRSVATTGEQQEKDRRAYEAKVRSEVQVAAQPRVEPAVARPLANAARTVLAAPAVYREVGDLQPVPTMRTIISGEGGSAAPQFSPDGKRIAFMSNRTGPWQIWVSDVDGSNARRVSFTESAGTPRWSPDGRSIAFDAPSDDGTSIYVVRVDGGDTERRLVEGLVPSFSRDGKWVYFASDRTGDWQVWRVPSTGGEPERLTRQGGFAALESPDGYLYYSKSRYPNPEICRVPVAGGDESCTLPHLRPRTWSSWAVTREGILFVEDAPGGRPMLSLYEPAKRQVRDLVSLKSAPFWMGASADGKKAIVNDAAESQISMVEGLR